jgi:SAM-dependent methyltransferase
MCNAACLQFVQQVVTPQQVQGKSILEVGSYDVNGSARAILAPLGPASYTGVDLENGPGVDEVVSADRLVDRFGEDAFDIVVSTEMVEHLKEWRPAVSNLKAVLKREGVLILTTRSRGFPYHAFPEDYWRYEESDMRRIFGDLRIESLESDPIEPGVFLKARKPKRFREKRLGGVKLYSIVHDRRVKRHE